MAGEMLSPYNKPVSCVSYYCPLFPVKKYSITVSLRWIKTLNILNILNIKHLNILNILNIKASLAKGGWHIVSGYVVLAER